MKVIIRGCVKALDNTRFAWALHNLMGHPLCEILGWFQWNGLAQKIHDWTIPTVGLPASWPGVDEDAGHEA